MQKDIDKIKAVEKFEKTNNTKVREIPQKDLSIILHEEMKHNCRVLHHEVVKNLKRVEDKIDEHIKWSDEQRHLGYKIIADHDKIFEKIMNVLPEKGFCERVTNTLYIADGTDKVELLWNDRRWIKKILGLILATVLSVGGANIIINVW